MPRFETTEKMEIENMRKKVDFFAFVDLNMI